MFGLALVAHEFIVLTIGEKWLPSVPLLQILCIGGAFMPLHAIYQNFIISRGRSDIYLVLVAAQIVLQTVLTLSLFSLGIEAMVAAFSILNIVYLLVWHIALRHIQPITTLSMLKDTMPFALIALAVMAATYYATTWNDVLWIRLVLRVVIAAMIYLGIMLSLRVKTLEEWISFVRKKQL